MLTAFLTKSRRQRGAAAAAAAGQACRHLASKADGERDCLSGEGWSSPCTCWKC